MYIKIQKEKILLLLLMFLFIDSMNYFYTGITINSKIILFLIAASVLFSIYTYQTRIHISGPIKIYFFLVLISILSIAFFSGLIYDQTFIRGIMLALRYILILLVIPISLIIEDKQQWNYILEIVNIIALIWYIIVIVQALLYTATGTVILPYYATHSLWTRNNHIRIGLHPYGHYMILYNCYMYVVKKSKKSFWIAAIGIVALLYVDQTRAYEAIIAAIALMCIILNQKHVTKRMIMILCVALLGALLFALGIDSMIIESFSATGENANSTIARLYAIAYYWECFVKNPLFGFGFTGDSTIINGPLGIAWPSDVGLIGQLAQIGLFVIPIYISMIVYLFVIAKNKEIDMDARLFVILNLVYILLCSGTLIILDSGRSIIVPIIIASVNSLICDSKKQVSMVE